MTKNRLLILTILIVILLQIILQLKSFAAIYDRITINVKVFDQSTGSTYEIVNDYVSKGNNNFIQSVPYRIPKLSEFVDKSLYGSVIKVAGNWYYPSRDMDEEDTVEWSSNVNNVTMTYWVTSYKKPGGSTGSDTTDTVSIGTGGSHNWTQYIVYHSNYPDGTDYKKTITYNIKLRKQEMVQDIQEAQQLIILLIKERIEKLIHQQKHLMLHHRNHLVIYIVFKVGQHSLNLCMQPITLKMKLN